MMAGICNLISRDPNADDRTQLGMTFKQLHELTRIMVCKYLVMEVLGLAYS